MNTSHTTTARSKPRRNLARRAGWLFLPLALLIGTAAMAQADATLDQVYQAARSGQLDRAQQLMQPVLRDHPNSAKAHYVEAELLARQGGHADRAREELAMAQRLAPGLPFAHADAVQSLQRQLHAPAAARDVETGFSTGGMPGGTSGGMPWGILLAIAGGGLMAWLLMRMGRPQFAPATPSPAGFPATGTAWPASGAAPAAPAATAAAAPSAGLGHQVVGGLATGLAVGAGVMAAESIAHRLFSNDAPSFGAQRPTFEPMPDDRVANPDLGGRDFGIDDAGSWDDAAPGGNDWDT